jgi:hypothetical protein
MNLKLAPPLFENTITNFLYHWDKKEHGQFWNSTVSFATMNGKLFFFLQRDEANAKYPLIWRQLGEFNNFTRTHSQRHYLFERLYQKKCLGHFNKLPLDVLFLIIEQLPDEKKHSKTNTDISVVDDDVKNDVSPFIDEVNKRFSDVENFIENNK